MARVPTGRSEYGLRCAKLVSVGSDDVPDYEPASTAAFYDVYGEAEWARLETAYGRLQAVIHGDVLAEHVREGQHVLDAGCGPGRFTSRAAQLGADVVALDSSPGQLDLARRTCSTAGVTARATFVEGDIVDLSGLPDDAFDVVVCFGGALFYVRERRWAAAAELVRVCRPGGVLLVSVMSRLGSACNVVRQGGIADPDEPARVRSILTDGELSGVPFSRVPGFAHPPMHLYTGAELVELLAGCQPLTLAGSNVTLSQGDPRNDALLTDEQVWAEVVATERRCCCEPGFVDVGSHIILAARVH